MQTSVKDKSAVIDSDYSWNPTSRERTVETNRILRRITARLKSLKEKYGIEIKIKNIGDLIPIDADDNIFKCSSTSYLDMTNDFYDRIERYNVKIEMPTVPERKFSSKERYEKVRSLPPISEEDREFRKWEEELNFFNVLKEKLLKDKGYRNKFLAIKDKKLIDSDINKFRLVKRMNEKYPREVVLVARLIKEVPAGEIPSPECRYEV